MARDYKARKYITEQAAQCGDERISNALIRAFDMMYSNQDHNGCFSTSVALHVIRRSFGYDPKLCYGLCVSPSGKGMYHAWLELDGKVLDLAIYGNSHFSPYWIDEPLGPVVFEDYNDTMMHYGNHEFDEDWNGSMISKAVEMGSIAKYITNAPHVNHPSGNGIWKMIFTILDETYTEDRQIDLQQFVSNDPI